MNKDIDVSLSPYEKEINDLICKMNTYSTKKIKVADNVIGPKLFIENVIDLDISKLISQDDIKNQKCNFIKHIQAGQLQFKDVIDPEFGVKNPLRVLKNIYLRAFQSMVSKKYLRSFILGITQGCLSEKPCVLSKINPLWCDLRHETYMTLWRSIHKNTTSEYKSIQDEILLGKSILKNITSIKGIQSKIKDKKILELITAITKHDDTTQLCGKILNFVNSSNTKTLIKSSVNHSNELYKTSDINMAKIVRIVMGLMKQNGIDTGDGMSMMKQFLKKAS